MRTCKIGFSIYFSLLSFVSALSIPCLTVTFITQPAIAQTANNRKAEAEQLYKQGLKQINSKQIDNARESLEKALTIVSLTVIITLIIAASSVTVIFPLTISQVLAQTVNNRSESAKKTSASRC